MRRPSLSMLMVGAILVTASCAINGHDDARIVVPGFDRAGGALSDTHAGIPYTNGDLILCLTKPGNVVIIRVDQIDVQGGLRIDDFAVIPNAMEHGGPGVGDNNIPVAGQVTKSHPAVLTQACQASARRSTPSASPRSVALLLQYGKPSDATASDSGIVIRYTSNGRPYSLQLDWEITLCAPGDTATGRCGG